MTYRERRAELIRRVCEQHSAAQGNIVIAGSYEDGRHVLWQDSAFWYFTGISEPGALMVLSTDGVQTLYVPAYSEDRAVWMECDDLHVSEFDEIKPIGDHVRAYHPTMWFSKDNHKLVLGALKENAIFVCAPPHLDEKYTAQRWTLERWSAFYPDMHQRFVDISAIIADMRRRKSTEEIAFIEQAARITLVAQQRVGKALHDGILESELHALVMCTFLQHGARAAFPSIIAGGHRATILHYHANNQAIRAGELVVVDIGASVQGYAADVTRTFAIQHQFSERQQFLYDLVCEAQQAVFEKARPGMWLCNASEPERSLHHHAVAVFKRHNLERHFVHRIGHFLGLDVHDVGNSQEPLGAGDVITIEPGLYLREEGIGIRQEDDYLITDNGAVCLSDSASNN